ncbi:MAG: hypothetical protein E7676_06185 [Ruminococcaceae bacterium]|nr:hypothetical protein [Oscillospiraceae bacterium]
MHNNEKNAVLEALLRIVNQFLPVLFWITLIFGFEEPRIAVHTIISAFIHESGHVIYLKVRGITESRLRGDVSGFRIRSCSVLSYRDEIMLYLCGPMANILAALLLSPVHTEWATLLSALNIATAVSNLLPVEGYDGYGALHALAEKRNPHGLCVRILDIISAAIIFSFCILSIYFIDRFGAGYWIFALFFASMLKQLNKWLKI